MATREATAENRERARQAMVDHVADWSPDWSLELGDTHDKGESSLCVGEAA